ncbi:histidine phosphatase family protein [Gordonia sp. CPCC 205333]|uniref:histidine phosphatase family protein n=1 Tax=Gordonia sp. CPCC 205333 TaxID=3140790 RepID=UPI003AF38C81
MTMQIITAGRTAPNKLVRFGGADRPLDERGRRDVAALRTSSGILVGPIRCGPEAVAVQTAALLGCAPVLDEALRALDVGRWDGLTPEDVPTDELRQWFGDPTSAPHGGESVEVFVARISKWRERADAGTVVVAKSVAQALLCRDVGDFFSTELRPATIYGEGR